MAKKKKQRSNQMRSQRRKKASGSYDQLAVALQFHQAGNLIEAERGYRKILMRDPTNPDALHLCGVVKSQQGEYEAAIQLIERAIDKYPHHADFHINLGNALAHHGEVDEAIERYRQAIQINPGHVDVHHNMGNLLKRAHRFPEAIQHLQKALLLKPDRAEIYNDLGNVLIDMRQMDDAIACYHNALNLKPNYPAALNNMGTALKILERYREAIQFYEQAIQMDPSYTEAFNNLGATFEMMGKSEEAIQFGKKALELRPDFDLARVDLYYALKRTCSWIELEALDHFLDIDAEKAIRKGTQIAEDPFMSLARHGDPAINLAVAKSWSDGINAMTSRIQTNFSFTDRNQSTQKITLGYLSKNFRNHAMAHLMAGLFERHDRNRFEVYAYSIGEDDNSEYRKRIEKGCDKFVDIRNRHHLEAAQTIYNDKVDILIDLMGYTRGGRMEIAALRPAPIQVRYMGMAGSTGSDFFDYLIADQTVVPVEHARHYSEKLVYLPNCYQVNDYEQAIADIDVDRRDLGLPPFGFVYCSFNQLFKLDPFMFSVWMTILKKVPDSVLWLQEGPKTAEKNLLIEAEKRGVKAARIVFGPKVPKDDHLARLSKADVALDTRIVNGAATTSDALWAGVPVVAVMGTHFSSRMSASILKACGMSELIAPNLTSYLDLAVRMGQDADFLFSIREKLKVNRRGSQLFNTARTAKNLDVAYNSMWHAYRAGQTLAPIDVGERNRATFPTASCMLTHLV
jgi:protein O-GlcNAc transferase